MAGHFHPGHTEHRLLEIGCGSLTLTIEWLTRYPEIDPATRSLPRPLKRRICCPIPTERRGDLNQASSVVTWENGNVR